MSTTICIKMLHSIDDPEEHVGGVQQDGHGQLRRRGGRGGQWQVHLSSVLLGEEKHTLLDSGSVPIKVHSRSIKCTRKRHKIIQICCAKSTKKGDHVLISDFECMSLAFARVKELLQDCATVHQNQHCKQCHALA